MRRISVEDIKVGMLVHDESGPVTFIVTSISVSEHSTQVYGKSVHAHLHTLIAPGVYEDAHPETPNSQVLVVFGEHQMLYINGDSGLWRLDC